jgi:large subunit ribosomal protein L9
MPLKADTSLTKVGITMARTKVLLTDDVMDLGDAGDVRIVAGGYARNYLFPRNLAVLATKGSLKQAEEIRRAGMIRRAQQREHSESQAEVISGLKLMFETKAGETDRLYGSVTMADIADRLEAEAGFEVDRRHIQMEHPIRDLGIYELTLRFMTDVSANFLVAAVRENEAWEDAETRVAEKAATEAIEAAEAEAAIEAQAEDSNDVEDSAEEPEAEEE